MRKSTFTLVPVAVVGAFLGLGVLTAQSTAAADEEPAAACHNMRDPKSLRDDQWRAAVAHMRVRAHLTAEEAENVLVFLQQSN